MKTFALYVFIAYFTSPLFAGQRVDLSFHTRVERYTLLDPNIVTLTL